MMSSIRYMSFPRTEPPPQFAARIIDVFREHEPAIATELLERHLKSDEVLATVGADLRCLGFEVEVSKARHDKISRPVFFGENGEPTLRYEVDAYHPEWRCGLDIEGIRAIRGGALYRDLIQAMVMVQVDFLCLAVPNLVQWGTSGKSRSYIESVRTLEALYGHTRFKMPYRTIIIGY